MTGRKFAHAFVTGAAHGIGRCFAHQLAQTHTRISVVDVDIRAARRVAAELEVRGAEAIAFECDVRNPNAIASVADNAEQALGAVDLLVNNAGVLTAGAALDTSLASMHRAFDVNLWGVIHGCSVFAPRMVERRNGHILTVASLAGVMQLPQLAAYSATKAAVIAYSEALRAELWQAGVGVTLLLPSLVDTGFVERASSSDEVRSLGNRLLSVAGQSPEHVAQVGLRAAAGAVHLAVPSVVGGMAWRLKRLAPRRFAQLSCLVARAADAAA